MVTILHSLHNLIKGILLYLGGHSTPRMWPFRWPSQDQEVPVQCSTSQAQPQDVKSVRAALEKVRGYHDLAKVRS